MNARIVVSYLFSYHLIYVVELCTHYSTIKINQCNLVGYLFYRNRLLTSKFVLCFY